MFDEWLGTIPPAKFRAEIYRKQPFSMPDRAKRYTELATWGTIERLLRTSPPDALVVRNGSLLAQSAPASFAEARKLHAAGCSLVLRHCERHDEGLARLAREVEREIGGEVAVQLYVTPAAFHSFGWHYDFEEVFIVQTLGEKEYWLRENTVNPRPTRETMPKDMQYERETSPTQACTLLPGDWLYVPGGWWHVAKAKKDSISLSIGVIPPKGD